jgi:hypothetical protein
MDTDGETFKPVYLFNVKLVHLVDDIFWLMSFRSAEHAEKVLRLYFNYCDRAYSDCFRSAWLTTSSKAHGIPRAQNSPLRYVSWATNSVRNCVRAGLTTWQLERGKAYAKGPILSVQRG